MASAHNSKREIIDLDSASADEGEDSRECRGQPHDQQATLDLDSDPFGVCPGDSMMIDLSSDEGEKKMDSEEEEPEQEETLADLPLTAAALEALQRDLPTVAEQEEAESEASSTGAFNAVGPPRRSRRHPRCAGPACNFSTTMAGQPSRVTQEGEKCMWCNPSKFSKALATSAGRARINKVVNQLQRAASPALNDALQQLPPDFVRKNKYCTSPGCCFSRAAPGKPAQVDHGATCSFCTFEGSRLAAEGSPSGRAHLWVSLAIFFKKNKHVLSKAWARISDQMKRNCANYMEWTRSSTGKMILEETKAKARKERECMWQEDFLSFDRFRRLHRAIPEPRRSQHITIVGSMGPEWFLKPPQRACHHPQLKYFATEKWRCPMNATTVPPCPPEAICRVCTTGFRPHDPKPAVTDYYSADVPPGLFPEPHQEAEAQRRHDRDMYLWEEMQARHVVEPVEPGTLRWFAVMKACSTATNATDTAGLFPPEELASAGAGSASPRAQQPKRRMKRSPPGSDLE